MSRLFKNSILFAAALAAMSIVSCNDTDETSTGDDGTKTTQPAVEPLKLIPYSIVKEYPHDSTAYTEGLEYVDGKLYESTGHYGKSDIRITDLATGKILKQQKMADKYFGEGMTILGDKIYQLTYQEKTGFVYDKQTLKPLQTFSYNTAEGWGMTTDKTHLIYGDGQTSLVFLDPATLKEVKRVEVVDQYGPVGNVNELEYINGYIYANQWQTNMILKINPADGKVLGYANLDDIRRRTGIPEKEPGNETAPEELNGIAYDAASNRIFITGKNWPKIIEIKLDN
jgi:glutaminyl-peptide cyclotransferase